FWPCRPLGRWITSRRWQPAEMLRGGPGDLNLPQHGPGFLRRFPAKDLARTNERRGFGTGPGGSPTEGGAGDLLEGARIVENGRGARAGNQDAGRQSFSGFFQLT